MRPLIIAIVCLAVSVTVSTAQTVQPMNRLQFSLGNFFVVKHTGSHWVNPTMGIAYTRSITNNFSITGSFSKWGLRLDNSNGFGNGYSEKYIYPAEGRQVYIERSDYHMIDLSGNYALLRTNKHEISTGLGLSYCFGKERISEELYPAQWMNCYSEPASFASHFGGLWQLGYNYFIAKGKGSIGISGGTRYYPGMPLQQYINFNTAIIF